MDGLCATQHSTGSCQMHDLTPGEKESDGAESCTLNGVTYNHPVNVFRGQIFQAESATLDTGISTPTGSKNSGGKRVGNIGPTAKVTFKNVLAGAAGANNLVIYYADGDCGSMQRYFNVKVNGGPVQNKSFAIVAQGDWSQIGQAVITLDGFTAGANNTVQFMGDGSHAAPDLDWIEVVAAPGTGSSATTGKTCAAGSSVAIQSMQNLQYASARSDNANNVMAQATGINTWETFDVVDAGGGYVALKSRMNGLYVAADLGVSASGPLKARSAAVGNWEKFQFIKQSNGNYAIKANANGLYVSARVDTSNAPLQASASAVNAWEMFTCQ
jgi:hypothetical protein